MVIPGYNKFSIEPFWDDSFKTLTYTQENFNDNASVKEWLAAGYPNKFTGEMCDMRYEQPYWNAEFIDMFNNMGWTDIGTSYYRMRTGTVLPVHQDLYSKYVKLHGLLGMQDRIYRAIVFLEDWKSGHYSEVNGDPIVNWRAGDVICWNYDLPHAAANIGLEDRYTLQITGWV